MHVALRQLPGAVRPWGGLHRMTIPVRAADYFTFCFARNPYARLYSHYCCCWGQRRPWWQQRWWAGRVTTIDYADYLRKLQQTALGGSCGAKYQPTVRGYTGPARLDAVLRYEDLPAAWLSLATHIPGIERIELPRKGCCLATNWRSVYTPELAEMVYDIARADFDEFGYDRDSWQVPVATERAILATSGAGERGGVE